MAKSANSEKVDFSLVIGLDTDALFAGMDKANTTISQAIARINSENAQVKLKFDTASIKAGTDEVKKQELAIQSLTRQLELQKQKLQILGQARDKAYQNYGQDKSVSRAAETAYLRQERTVAQLTAELQRLQHGAQKADASTSSLFGHISKGATEARGGLSKLSDGYTLLSTKAAAALAIATTAGGLFNITDGAMKSGEALYQLSKRLQMSTADAALFKRTFDFVGADVQSVIPFFSRLDKAVMSAGENGNTTTEALQEFGVSVTDSSGKLLPLNEQLAALAKGYQNARDSGKDMEFTAQVLGSRGAALIPVLEQFRDAYQRASNVKTSGLLNPQEAYETYLEWQAMKLEASQLSTAFGAAMLPIAKEIMPDVEDALGNLVDNIKNNKEEIKDVIEGWAGAFGTVAKSALDAAEAAGKAAKAVQDSDLNKSNDAEKKKFDYDKAVLDANGYDQTVAQVAGGIGGGILGGRAGGWKGALFGGYVGQKLAGGADVYLNRVQANLLDYFGSENGWSKMVERYNAQKQAKEQEAEAEKKATEESKKNTSANAENSKAANENASAQGKAKAAVEARKTAVGQLSEEIYKLTHSDYENSMHELQNKVQDLTAASMKQSQIDEYVNAYQSQMQRKMQSGLLNPISDAYKTDLQKSLDDIDRQAQEYKRQWAGAGQDSKIDAWAQTRKSQISADWDKEVSSQIDSIWKSSYENRIHQIEQEKQAWIKKGLDEVKATQWAEESKRQAMQETAQGMFTSEKQYYKVWKKAGGQASGQAGIDAIANQMRKEKGIPSNAFTTPGEIQAFEAAMKAANSQLVPIVADGTYQGTKAAMIEVLRGDMLTGANAETGQEGAYQPYDMNATVDVSSLAQSIGQAVAQANTQTIEILKGTMLSTVQVAQSTNEAEISSYRVWTEQEAQQILQAADHTTAAFTSGETWFNQLGEEIKRNTDATDEQTKAMMDNAVQALSDDYKGGGDASSAIDKVSSVLDKQDTRSEQAAQKIVAALNQTSLQTRKQIQDFQAAQQKVRQQIYRTTNIYPRELTTDQITEIANTVYGRGMEEIEGSSAQNSY